MELIANWMLIIKLTITLLSFLTAHTRGAQISTTTTLSINAIYQFGDSISDTGNLLIENRTTIDCSSFPYGESYFHYPTGRCSDGLLMVDYYAKAFGLKFLNPYLHKEANLSNGVNFAVVAATALPISYLESKNISTCQTNSSLSVQLGWFLSYIDSICNSVQLECQRTVLGRSLILMEAIGGDDYHYAFTQGLSLQAAFQVAYGLAPHIVQQITNFVKQMMVTGAVNLVVPSLFPIGCLPCYLSLGPSIYDEVGCRVDFNKLAEYHNHLLLKGIQELQIGYPNTTLIYADYYFAITSLLQNVTSLGFDEEEKLTACCGYGKNPYNFNTSQMCGGTGVPVCPHPEKRVNWDGYHYTQHFYMHLSNWMLKNTIIPKLSPALLPRGAI